MLRVFLAAPPAADRADAWVRYAAGDRPIAQGRDVPSRWPSDASIEVVLAAGQVRLAAIDLPPMPRNRLAAAARFALEDQLATTDEAALAIAGNEGTVVAAIASDVLIRGIRASGVRIARIIPESALAPHADGWTWYASAAGAGFVRRADGSTFAVGAGTHGELPAELPVALRQAARTGAVPAVVHVAVPADATHLAQWSDATGVKFAASSAWRWESANAGAFAAAPDFLASDGLQHAPLSPSRTAAGFRPALTLAALALAIHAGGLLVEWAWLNLVDWRLSRALVREAAAAGLPNVDNPSVAAAAIAKANGDIRHRAGRLAPGDALPLLARAAPALAMLPSGTLKSARYANDSWTMEFAKVDAEALSHVTRALNDAGVDAISAPAAGGTRVRLSLGASAR